MLLASLLVTSSINANPKFTKMFLVDYKVERPFVLEAAVCSVQNKKIVANDLLIKHLDMFPIDQYSKKVRVRGVIQNSSITLECPISRANSCDCTVISALPK